MSAHGEPLIGHRARRAMGQRRNQLALLLALLGPLALSGCSRVWAPFEHSTLNPGFRSAATPAEVGLKFDRVSIPSGARKLDGFVVRAAPACPRTAAVLIFHGRGETIANWVKVQRVLHDACISSMTFDYSGHGRSSPSGTIDNLNADSAVAYEEFRRRFPGGRRCLLSHSMGGGPMLQAAVHASVAPDCVVVASPFSSLRDMAVRGGMPRWLSWLASDAWDNIEAASRLRAPMLWIHSTSDRTIPLELGRSVFAAKTGVKLALTVSGFNHNAIYQTAPREIWTPTAAFILGETQPSEPR
jgi:alpha-beta hydrolase superfamily lysophospholipase